MERLDVSNFSQIREYYDVEAQAKKRKAHVERVHELIYDKNYQLKEGNPASNLLHSPVIHPFMPLYKTYTCPVNPQPETLDPKPWTVNQLESASGVII